MRPMKSRRARVLLTCFVVAAVACGWYATRTVRPPDCEVAFSAFTGDDGRPLDQDGKEVTWAELDERAYRELVASGQCEPSAARWRHWLG
jgi:hypothetical protein